METKCSECGKSVGVNAVEGLCPECLIKVGLGSQAGVTEVIEGKKPSFVPPKPEEIAAKFPQLEILELLGRGGMGAVYKVRQKQLGRIVALKILPPGVGDEGTFAKRFAHEARALASLNHPNIVVLYEFGEADGLFFFLMEFVDGVNLRQLLQAGRIASKEALAIVPQICEALQYAHDQGIVHRDIKPENILLDRKGRVKVADFGIARLMGADAEPSVSNSEEAVSVFVSLTEAGKVVGTPNYMAPEQVSNPGEVDHRADIYALGVVFYQMLTGELPGKRIEAPSKKVQIDVRLDEIVLRALEKEPELRFQQASEFKTQIETIAGDLPSETASTSKATAPSEWLTSAAVATTTFFFATIVLLLFAGKLMYIRSPMAFSFTMLYAVLFGLGAFALSIQTFKWLSNHQNGDVIGRRWLQCFAAIAWITAVPVIGFGIFFLHAVATDSSWNPSFEEAIVVPLTWLGSIVLPLSGWVLLRAARLWRPDNNPTSPPGEQRGLTKTIWSHRFFWLIAAVIVIPLKLFAMAFLGGQLARQGINTVGFIVVLAALSGIALGLLLFLWGLLRAFRRSALDEANPWPRRIVMLLAMALLAPILLFAGATVVYQSARITHTQKSAALLHQRNAELAPKIESVVVSRDKAVVKQRQFKGEGMIITFGTGTNRWTPGSAYLDHLFNVTLEWPWSRGHGADWVIKTRHGTYQSYRLDGPPGPMLGKIVFHPGTPAPEADGSYVIAEFQPESGPPLPIAVKLAADKPASPSRGQAREPAAFFSPVRDPALGDSSFRLISTLAKPRHVVLSRFEFVDEQHSVSIFIPQLSFYFVLPDGKSNIASSATWTLENVTEGQGAWSVRVKAELGTQTFEQKLILAGNRPFLDLPGTPNNPNHGPYLGLDPKTTSWKAVRPTRSFWVGPGEWNERDWNSLSLFEASDKEGRIVARMRLQLLVCRLQADAKIPWATPILRNGDWRDDAEIKALLDAQLPENKHAKLGSTSRSFALRHVLASKMAEELRSVLLGKPGTEAQPSDDNLSITVTAPPNVLNRVTTFITVSDWPQTAARSPVLESAHSFFRACSIEDVEAVSKMLFADLLAQLQGTNLTEFGFLQGDNVDAELIRQLRGNWPGKEAAVRKMIDAWNKYPLQNLREDPGIAIGFGARYFASISFEGAPKAFYQISFTHDRNGTHTNALVIDTFPPWFPLTEKRETQSAFGSVHELTLKSVLDHSYEYIDFDTGRRAKNNIDDRQALGRWVRGEKMDAVLNAVGAGGHIVLRTFDLATVPASTSLWNKVTPQEIERRLSEQQDAPSIPGHDVHVLNPKTDKTDTYFFRTREGGTGILQIIGSPEDPGGVKIRYKLVQNSRTKVAVSTSAAVSSQTAATFGPVIERVLPGAEQKTGYEALDLRTGNFLSLPEQQNDDDLMLAWLKTNRVDFIAAWDPDPEDRNKIYLTCIKIRLSDFDIARWTNATPEECLAALKSGTTLRPLDESSMDEDFSKADVTVYLLPPEIQLPRTLAFQTRDGISGLLHITGYTDNPRGVKLRYKLVKESDKESN